jgi:DNA-binding transcriptional LysR family regulator
VSGSQWSDYRYFLAIGQAGSLSGAARRLGVDQSTVGRRLAALESAVGTRLFDRTPEGYALTPVGESVRADVERLEEGFLAVERRLSGGDTRIAGVVRVATTEAFASLFLIPRIAELRARHPALSLDMSTGIQPVDLARREADIAVRLGAAPKQPNLIARKVGVVHFAAYAARSYVEQRGTPHLRGSLAGHAIVAYGSEMRNVPIARWLEEHASDAEVAFRVNTIAGVYDAVRAGLGIGVLPSQLADASLMRIGSPSLGAIPIWSVVHEDLARAARVRAVLQFLSDVLKQPPPRGPALDR